MSYKCRTKPTTFSHLGVVEVVGSNPAGPILFFPGKTTLLDLVRDC